MTPTPGSMRDAPVVLTKGLSKVFKDFWMRTRVTAVDRLDLDVQRGEIFGLLGPNGSGKSTTIKILLGLLHKTSGIVAVFGKPPSDVAIKERIGVLPEESYLYPYLNAIETLDYYGKLFELGRRDRERRTRELLEMVGLASVAHRPIHEYSKGMQRRIGLAQALINDPEFLILDEPTSGLDPIGAKQVKDLIVDLGRRGKTVLLSSHQLSDVEDCVDRLVILYGGKKRAEGTCEELLTARDRMSIETNALDDDTITQIEEVLAAHGAGLRRVGRPRQRLEDLFMDIVDRARAERLETGGAQHGGATASFLVGGGAQPETRGEALIERLVADSAEPVGQTSDEPAPAGAGPTAPDVIGSLVSGASSAAGERSAGGSEQAKPRRDSKAAPVEAEQPGDKPDLDVIESLLASNEGESDGDEGAPS